MSCKRPACPTITPQDEEKRKASKLVGHKPGADVWGEAAEEQQLDQQKVLEALRRQEEREREVERDDRKRGYNSLAGQDVDVTPEEMEAYRLKKSRGADDPLAFIDKAKGQQQGEGGYGYV
jgi:pre-mRNA-processing factor SLU7